MLSYGNMKFYYLLLFNIHILSVQGFFYTLMPILVIKKDRTFTAYCPWNQTSVHNLQCKLENRLFGYFVPLSNNINSSVPRRTSFLNPYLQNGTIADTCSTLKNKYTDRDSKKYECKDYSFCYNITNDKRICSCQSGFFGNAYEACYQHCLTDDDCTSPLAQCGHGKNESELQRCVCPDGYAGNGVICYKNPCGFDRSAKCGNNKICVPTGPGKDDYNCLCPEGHYLDHKNVCVPTITVATNTVISVVGRNIKDGSRIELGDCISFTLNDNTKSLFFHKNSGDSVYVKKLIKNENQFSIFFIVTDEITAYSSLKDGGFGLSKLYSISNTLTGCKMNGVRILDTRGHEYSRDEPFEVESTEKEQEEEALGEKESLQQPEVPDNPEAPQVQATSQEKQVPEAKEPAAEKKTPEAQEPAKAEQPSQPQDTSKQAEGTPAKSTPPNSKTPEPPKPSQPEKTAEEIEKEAKEAEEKRKLKEESLRPSVEVSVRNLTEQELAGGLSQTSKVAETLLRFTTSDERSTSDESQPKGAETETLTQQPVSTLQGKSEL